MRNEGRRPDRGHLGVARRGPLSCASVADVLPALAGTDAEVSRRVRDHVAVCLRCQADVAHYRRLRRSVRSLRSEPVDPGPTLAAEVLARIDAAGEDLRSSRVALRLACVGGISVATAAGAGMLVWMSRRRLVAAG